MSENVYERLAEQLDRLPGGFAPSETGAHLRLLEGLFTPEEAEIATSLTLDREPAGAIASRLGQPESETAARLDQMASKGLLFSVKDDDGQMLYQAVPWVVGIYEFQVKRLTQAFLSNLAEYHRTSVRRESSGGFPQMRTIPIGESVDADMEILPYERVEELINAHDTYAVVPCICRLEAANDGHDCSAPLETCLQFGEMAEFAIRTGMGRAIDRAEVLDIIALANENNLVLQPTNSQEISAICCCAGCCCGILRGIQGADKPAEVVTNAFIAQLDVEACVGCMTCLDRCQMDALSEDGHVVALDADRCIGCGLCVSTCPSGALTLRRKEGEPRYRTPVTFHDTQRMLAEEQAEA